MSAPTNGVTFTQIAKDAATSHFEGFDAAHKKGVRWRALATPVKTLQMTVAQCVRNGFDKVADKPFVRSCGKGAFDVAAILYNNGVVRLIRATNCLLEATVVEEGLKLPAPQYVTGKQLDDACHIPNLSPKQLVSCCQKVERLTLNMPLSHHIERRFAEGLYIGDGRRELPEAPLGTLLDPTLIPRCVMSDLSRFTNNAVSRTFHRTSDRRKECLEAIQGVALKLAFDGVVNRLPSRQTLVREGLAKGASFGATQLIPNPVAILGQLLGSNVSFIDPQWLLDPINKGSSVLGATTTFAINAPFKTVRAVGCVFENTCAHPPKLVEFGAQGVGFVAKHATNTLTPIAIEYGPLAHQVATEARAKWNTLGSRYVECIPTLNGLNHLITGAPLDLRDASEQQNSELVNLITNFTLGTLVKMCNDERLGDQKGLYGLFKLILTDAVNHLRQERTPAAEPVAREELPGMAEAKALIKILLNETWEAFKEELAVELRYEARRQQDSAKMTNTHIINKIIEGLRNDPLVKVARNLFSRQ